MFVFKILIVFNLIIIDFVSKQIVFYFINLNNFVFITNFFELTHIHNYGISFGLFSGFYSPWLFVFLGIIITLILIFMYFNSNNIVEKWGFLIIIAGALSNIIDRIFNGFVIDFLFFHYNNFYWPAFNFADIYISIGVFLILYKLINDSIKKVRS